jgi:glyoxylase-like metal-dependent hydrolase (beta-lactamase superfamily II)
MRRSGTTRLAFGLAAALAAAPVAALAHMGPPPAPPPPEPEPPKIRVQPIAEGAYCLYGRGGNIGVVAAPQAVFMVDTQFEALAPAIEDEIRKLSPAAVRWVVDTHHHFDHVGGNRHFARTADVIGHENVRARLYSLPVWQQANLPGIIADLEARLSGGGPLAAPYRGVLEGRVRLYKAFLESARGFKPEEVSAPAVTYADRMKIFLGEEEVEIFHVAAGHTDGDSIVYFPRRKVVHMGDLFVNGVHPFIDLEGGGSSAGWIQNLDAVLEKLPEDARVIPGHGEAAGVAELRRFRAYLGDLREAVSAALRAGKSLEQAVAEIRLEPYADLKPGFMSLQQNVDQVWREMGGKP